jgi:hypothetical protein
VNKKLYYLTHFEQNANNLKNTWKVINIQINRNKRNIKQITALRKPNNFGIPYNTSEIPDIMNNHFATTVCPQKSTLYRNYPIVIRVEIILLFFGTHCIGNNLSSKIPQPSTTFTSYLPRFAHSGSFVFEPVLPTELYLSLLIRLQLGCKAVLLEFLNALDASYQLRYLSLSICQSTKVFIFLN